VTHGVRAREQVEVDRALASRATGNIYFFYIYNKYYTYLLVLNIHPNNFIVTVYLHTHGSKLLNMAESSDEEEVDLPMRARCHFWAPADDDPAGLKNISCFEWAQEQNHHTSHYRLGYYM
jgi:hypothetical protein